MRELGDFQERLKDSPFLVPARENHYRTRTNVGNPHVMSWLTLGIFNPIKNKRAPKAPDPFQNPNEVVRYGLEIGEVIQENFLIVTKCFCSLGAPCDCSLSASCSPMLLVYIDINL